MIDIDITMKGLQERCFEATSLLISTFVVVQDEQKMILVQILELLQLQIIEMDVDLCVVHRNGKYYW